MFSHFTFINKSFFYCGFFTIKILISSPDCRYPIYEKNLNVQWHNDSKEWLKNFMTWHIFEWYGLFVWCFRPTREIFIHLKTSPLMMKGCKFWHLLVTHSNEGYLTCHTYCDTGQPSVAERLAVNLSLPVLTTYVCPDRGSNPDLSHARRKPDLYATAVVE